MKSPRFDIKLYWITFIPRSYLYILDIFPPSTNYSRRDLCLNKLTNQWQYSYLFGNSKPNVNFYIYLNVGILFKTYFGTFGSTLASCLGKLIH